MFNRKSKNNAPDNGEERDTPEIAVEDIHELRRDSFALASIWKAYNSGEMNQGEVTEFTASILTGKNPMELGLMVNLLAQVIAESFGALEEFTGDENLFQDVCKKVATL